MNELETPVAALLRQSREAHEAYRKIRRPATPAPTPTGWHEHLWDALTLREQAHGLDPAHADPAWADDKAPHAELMAFYRKQLGA